MDDFTKYGSLRSAGTDATGAYLIAKRDGLDLFACIRMLRSVYGLSLEEAKKTSVEADTGVSYEDHQAKLADAFMKVSDEMFAVEHKQVIVLRKDLNMRKGKMVAQGAHASMRAILQLGHVEQGNFLIPLDARIEPWLLGRFKKICVSVNSEAELLALHEAAKAAGLISALIQDAGLTEFGNVPTYTAVAVGPDREDRVDAITGRLPLP